LLPQGFVDTAVVTNLAKMLEVEEVMTVYEKRKMLVIIIVIYVYFH
jgi:hypothetical protein